MLALALSAALANPAARFEARWSSARQGAFAEHSQRAAQLPESCELAVIGAGWGGVYFAWRLAVDSKLLNTSYVCVFEANGRVGGRVFSVHNLPGMSDMAIDVGGYRFIETDKLSSQLVWDALKLPTACYDWECAPLTKPHGSHIIKDAYGNNRGCATVIERMLGEGEDAGAGTQVYFGAVLTAVNAAPATAGKRAMQLVFAECNLTAWADCITRRAFEDFRALPDTSLDPAIFILFQIK